MRALQTKLDAAQERNSELESGALLAQQRQEEERAEWRQREGRLSSELGEA